MCEFLLKSQQQLPEKNQEENGKREGEIWGWMQWGSDGLVMCVAALLTGKYDRQLFAVLQTNPPTRIW